LIFEKKKKKEKGIYMKPKRKDNFWERNLPIYITWDIPMILSGELITEIKMVPFSKKIGRIRKNFWRVKKKKSQK